MDKLITLCTAADVTPAVVEAAMKCAEAALGNNRHVDWERAYQMLESQYGFFVDEMDSPADRKIRRAWSKLQAESRRWWCAEPGVPCTADDPCSDLCGWVR